MKKILTTIRFTEEAIRLRKLISEKLGVNMSAVLELAIRELAKREGIE